MSRKVIGQVDNRVLREGDRGKMVEKIEKADAYTATDQPIVVFRPADMPEGVYGHLHVAHMLSVNGWKYFTSFAAVERALKDLLALTDWNRTREEFRVEEGLGAKVREVMERHGAREIPAETIERLAKKEHGYEDASFGKKTGAK